MKNLSVCRIKGNSKFKKKSNDENGNDVAKHVSNIEVMKHELNKKDKVDKELRTDVEMISK